MTDASRIAVIEALLERLYLGGGTVRDEERKKAREVADLLALVATTIAQPVPRGHARTLVDAAAGHGYVGLCAAALLGWRRVIAIERDPDRVARVRAAAARLDVSFELITHAGLVSEHVPDEADLVVALHACGPATDEVLASATQRRARWVLVAPCCYGRAVEGWDEANRQADRIRLPENAAVRGRFAAALIDGGRLDRLAKAGYDAQLQSFTPPTVTPHNLVFRARRGGVAGTL